MNKKHIISSILIVFFLFNIFVPVQVSYAAGVNNVLGTLASSTMPSSDGKGDGGLFEGLFSLLFDKILGPILNIFSGGKSTNTSGDNPVKVTPLPPPPNPGSIQDSGVLRGKVVVLDPGHGGNNPGAVANGVEEADNNLAVALKVRDKLAQAGAKVVMTRSSDVNVATVGSSLGEELQARLDIAEANHADIFVSIHSNSNDDSSIAGAMTFFPSGKSDSLALDVQSELIKQTGAVDKGTSSATFYVLRNAVMPSILIEMGFVSNPTEAVRLADDSYRNKIALGVFNGIVKYFNKN